MHKPDSSDKHLSAAVQKLGLAVVFLSLVVLALLYFLIFGFPRLKAEAPVRDAAASATTIKKPAPKVPWSAPALTEIPLDESGKAILYGRDLIANTAKYLGPHGSVARVSNGMNCQNCHLDAGTRLYGNNYSAVASTYPKFRERSGRTENIYKRVNDCFERSLNGHALDSTSREMQAIKAYITWLGKDVPKGSKPEGVGIVDLPYPDRAADPEKGKTFFASKCVSCHGTGGEGKMNTDGITYQYPPLWGQHSYNDGAGLFRLTRFAGYIKYNMPFGATHDAPQLTDEEAWDIAAFVNAQSRPKGNISKDWPKLSGKPIDNPFGPYADSFSQQQHRLGPYGPIAEARKKQKKETRPTQHP
jgi:thiosulfate dehydrogenase